jgi:hypothetical protein
VKTVVETITPEVAAQYLAKNPKNRRIRKGKVKALAAIVKQGHWELTHQGIAFNCDGSLKDGQHRLAAVIEAGKPITTLVTRGLSDDAMLYVDTGSARSDADAFTINGLPTSLSFVAAARALWGAYADQQWGFSWGSVQGSCDRETLLRFMTYHHDALCFAFEVKMGRGISKAPVLAAIAAAWWTADSGRLTQFRDQLASGIINNRTHDSAVIRLRDYLLGNSIAGKGEARNEVYGRTCTALMAYLEKRSLTKLYCRKDATFPLPVMRGVKCVASVVGGDEE